MHLPPSVLRLTPWSTGPVQGRRSPTSRELAAVCEAPGQAQTSVFTPVLVPLSAQPHLTLAAHRRGRGALVLVNTLFRMKQPLTFALVAPFAIVLAGFTVPALARVVAPSPARSILAPVAAESAGPATSAPAKPALRIASVVTESGAALEPGDLLAFCTSDTVRVEAESNAAGGLEVRWQVGTEPGLGVPQPAAAAGTAIEFRLEGLSREVWPDPHTARPGLFFTLRVALVDTKGREVAGDEKIIWQSDLGQLRQEYADHPLNPAPGNPAVPAVSEFRRVARDGYVNDGDYDWALIAPWTEQTDRGVQNGAAKLGIRMAVGAVRASSVYRSPARHWRLYAELGQRVTTGSRHLWGQAVDYIVEDFDGDGTVTRRDYDTLADLTAQGGGKVVWEGRLDHVHVQQQ